MPSFPRFTTTLALAMALALPLAAAADAPARGWQGLGFEDLDRNGDGVITREAFDQFRAERLAAIDADGDGFITREEFRAHHGARAAARAKNRADRMFDRLDGAGSGRIPLEGLAERRTPGTGLFERMDSDGDGVVSRDEFEAWQDRQTTRRAEMRERMREQGRAHRREMREGRPGKQTR